jgi:hypothetical protein
MSKAREQFTPLSPNLQVSFFYRLNSIRQSLLRESLQNAINGIDLAALDDELRTFVPKEELKRVATFGLRGEVFFPTPLLLQVNPFLLGYYRLLYGISQKEFYNKGPFGRFKRMEDRGECSEVTSSMLPALCRSLVHTGAGLVNGLDTLSQDIVHELQLLTIGPQLRGSENTRVGESAVQEVMELIQGIVKPAILEKTNRSVLLRNAAGRHILIAYSSDPDVLITEKLEASTRYVLSIEVKGGKDASNIHNRLGEAEKSHLKAKRLGCVDLWTVLRVEIPQESAERGSPTTTKFFHLDRICNRRSQEHKDFRESLVSRIGI